MSLNLEDTLRTARMQLIADALSGGTLTLYTTPKPAIGAAITTQTALVNIDLPLGLTAVDAALALSLSVSTISAEGEASWGRFSDSADDFVADGTCGLNGSDNPIQLRTTFLSAGGNLTPIIAVLSEP